ncbi:hypothetical protein FF38_05520 [Lucilia cuprina]|uniref:G-protein coupled receptors family 1 profile domain-containing protein n=1 Tax=Lucilia cuprina TaxID=7375 RepID=A0A0L0C9G4_LUCCU|nr:Neuropeptide Y receptor type 1 [Lucilia cuprina]KAI8119212.1 Neuropeptide Y receptor type 1 [Lucilia cuprina]KNC29078.1 hypothetical protein FF38_05520 [Lucilia cuprina]
MNSNNLQQWWENTYRHHLTKQQQQQVVNFDSGLTVQETSNSRELLNLAALQQSLDESNISEGLSTGTAEASIGVLDYDHFGNLTYVNPYDGDRDEHTIPSLTLLFMAISYGLVVFGGVLGNATLLLTLCSASSVRLRNPLLLAVCIADLLVTGISAPVTLLNLAMNRKTKTLPLELCKVIDFIQATPVAASTLSFFLLSLDRYATVKHPRLAQLRQRRYLHVSLAVFSWLTSAIVSVPFLFIYKIVARTVVMKNSTIKTSPPTSSPTTSLMAATTTLTPSADFPNVSISCHSDPGANPVFVVFILIHTFIVFILPGFGVLLNHYGVRRKLCALSLTARAAHGELPLPMPILRRQTHMVIVTGIANAHQAGCGGATDDTSNGGDIQMQNLNPRSAAHSNRNVILSKNPISPRAMREIREHSQRQRMARAAQRGRRVATPGIPLPQTSTLRSRRHLANMLIGSAIIFIACWAPHVFCVLYKIMGYKEYCKKSSRYFNLLLGYMYSALSPIIYWALNHNSLRQSPCAPIIRLRSMQKFLRTRFRSNPVPPAPSSTNEAQLGAFNPKLIKLTPKQYRAQASSHYLY